MTPDEIIAMAKEAGFGTHMDLMDDPHMQSHAQRFFQKLDSFAALVAAKEREATLVQIRSAIQAARYHFSDPNRRDASDRVLMDLMDDVSARGQKDGA